MISITIRLSIDIVYKMVYLLCHFTVSTCYIKTLYTFFFGLDYLNA